MTTLASGLSTAVALPQGATLFVSGVGRATVVPQGAQRTPRTDFPVNGTEIAVGPFTVDATINLVASGSDLTYQVVLLTDFVVPRADGKGRKILAAAAGAMAQRYVLVVGASTAARANPIQAIQTAQLSLTSNTINFRTSTAYPMRAGHRIRIAANNYPEIEGTYMVVSAVAEAPGTRVIAVLQDGLSLPDKALGAVTGNSCDMHDLQCWSSAAGWPSLLQNKLGGRARVMVLATGGTTVDDWNNVYRQQQILAHIATWGQPGAIIIDPGCVGNSVNGSGQSADQAYKEFDQFVSFAEKLSPVVVVSMTPAATSENTSSIATNTAKAAAATRINTAVDRLTRTHPTVVVAPIYAAEVVNYGTTDTTDITNGYALKTNKADDGIHNLWGACDIWSGVYAVILSPMFPYRAFGMGTKLNSVLNSAAADPSGKNISNILEGLWGTVAQAGNIPNSCAVVTASLNGMTVSGAIQASGNGGSDWLVNVNSNGNTALAGTVISQVYNGTTNSLLTKLNLAANQGQWLDSQFNDGAYGFNELSVSYVEHLLEVDTGDGQGYITLAAAFTTNGQFQAAGMTYLDASKGAQNFGYNGPVMFPLFQVPPGTVYTAARLRRTVKPKTGSDPGIFTLRFGGDQALNVLN